MELRPINIYISGYPAEFHPLLSKANIYDSSGHSGAKVIFIDKDGGYFLKSAPKSSLEHDATMMSYFHSVGLSVPVLSYVSADQDWLLTEKINGDDCTTAKYLEHPEKLCDTLAEILVNLHAIDPSDCPIQNHTEKYLESARANKLSGNYDKSHFEKGDSYGYATANEAWRVVETKGHLLQNKALLHGDYCLPNIILDDWKFSAFIDLGCGGVGDPHVDIFWALWSLSYNLKTQEYGQRFMDAYGRDKIDEEKLLTVAAVEVFG